MISMLEVRWIDGLRVRSLRESFEMVGMKPDIIGELDTLNPLSKKRDLKLFYINVERPDSSTCLTVVTRFPSPLSKGCFSTRHLVLRSDLILASLGNLGIKTQASSAKPVAARGNSS